MKAVVAAFNQEKALVGAFSVITNLRMELFETLVDDHHVLAMSRFRHDSYRDALVISAADTLTSVLAGAVIFSILGHLSHELGRPVQEVVKSGAGLAFVSYPEVEQCYVFAVKRMIKTF